ncbi:hypothetical protein [Tenacibaculum agarivorans]|uniref:hypothetical protein n=1 Tax=Tenacibaculum agarivorans TaxID=1908389 RepID=UPI00094BC0FF|nr:hypothetical protein [Tenacibaculum agarivorans]
MLLRGIKGTYLYACNYNLKTYLSSFIYQFKKERETSKISLLRTEDVKPYENAVPFYDLKISAGNFSNEQLAEDQIYWINIQNRVRLNQDFFACQVIGESMNKVVPNGSFCLFKKDNGGLEKEKLYW